MRKICAYLLFAILLLSFTSIINNFKSTSVLGAVNQEIEEEEDDDEDDEELTGETENYNINQNDDDEEDDDEEESIYNSPIKQNFDDYNNNNNNNYSNGGYDKIDPSLPANSETHRAPGDNGATYVTKFCGGQIVATHNVYFFPNRVSVEGNVQSDLNLATPPTKRSNAYNTNGNIINEFFYYNDKIKITFTITPRPNGSYGIDYNAKIIDFNI